MEGEEIGVVGYDLLDPEAGHVAIDLWMKAERFSGHGSDALEILCDFIQKKYGIAKFFMRPSAGNARTWPAFEKCGVEILPMSRDEFNSQFGVTCVFEYADNAKSQKNIPKAAVAELA
jgi:RimJ/RimL family protein N-acetyltransferase